MVDGPGPDFSATRIATCYQPIVRMADRAPVGVEALARLNDPGRGLLSPGDFVPQIEEAGQGCEFTLAIITRVLDDIVKARPARGARPVLGTWINVPLDVLLMPRSMDQLSGMRAAAGLDATCIHIELTESRPVANTAPLRDALERARAEGFQVALDDYAPTMPLHRELLDLPFSSIKFDHLLVAAAADDPEPALFMQTSIAAAQARGMAVVAEGVEDAATWDRLRALGVDAAQGFWIAAPLPPEGVEPWRRRWVGECADG